MIEKIAKKFDIVDWKLFYEGPHNKTYVGFFFKQKVQVRISKNNIVDHNNEIAFLQQNDDVIYLDHQVLIKKWIEGTNLNCSDKNMLLKIKEALIKHWSLKIENISHCPINEFKNLDPSEIVLSHGDLRKKNIIVDHHNEIHLIDFEWVNYNTKYFDLAHLHLYCDFEISDLVEVFNIDKEKLLKNILVVQTFNSKWEQKQNELKR